MNYILTYRDGTQRDEWKTQSCGAGPNAEADRDRPPTRAPGEPRDGRRAGYTSGGAARPPTAALHPRRPLQLGAQRSPRQAAAAHRAADGVMTTGEWALTAWAFCGNGP